MAVLVAGAAGFLGKQLVERLLANGREVVAVARQPAPEVFLSNPGVRWIERDIAREGLDVEGLPELEVVVHLAGATSGAGSNELLFMRANEQTTVRLFQSLADRVERFVFASSQVVYGDARHLGVTEEFPLQPDSSPYACSKINSENWLRWFQKRHGGQYLALRLCGFIDGGGMIDYLIDRALADEPIKLFARGEVRRDYLPSAEGIDVLQAAVDYQGASGFLPVNIGSGQAIAAHQLASLVCDELESSSPIERQTALAPQGDFVFSIERAQDLFGFRPGSMLDAVRRYARLRQNQCGAGNAKN